MSRWILAFMLTGIGLFASSQVIASDKTEKTEKSEKSDGRSSSSSSKGNETAETDPAQRIDKAIAAYESRSDEELDQIRKEISRSRKELSELSDLQLDLAVSLAELQAELRVMATARNASGGDNSPGSGAPERQKLRSIELARELRNVQENLRSLVQQKRNETDQVVIQLRNLRAQHRQMAGEAAAGPQAGKMSRD